MIYYQGASEQSGSPIYISSQKTVDILSYREEVGNNGTN